MQQISTFLWFDDNAEEAVKFYGSIFKDFKILETIPGVFTGKGDKPTTITFQILGQEIIALNGGPHYKFTPAVSFFVKCKTQDEVDYYWDRLSAGGKEIQCGWLTDQFGLCWQIVPIVLLEMLTSSDREKSGRAFAAMENMIKLNIADLQKAFDGK